ncbi:class I SAM-dependent methyltransferase [Serinicoccus kebangsaanensis]|uniref:class I SAM-dependent methyltransferase n=1 Tax=Serinicoccus kebangsaanensis TaxID=2602069 RepID=UPI00124BD1C4|nr:class I SAM-dependent methyltransferase [Serinicoccus kebangsaanensis]
MDREHARRWDRLAPRYDQLSAGMERRLLAASRPWVAGRAVGRVLEVGVGTGANLPHYPVGVELTCLERSAAMLAQARRRASDLGLQVDFVHGDAGAMDLPDGAFDTVVSTFTLCCVPDLDLALREMTRVLRPGGSLLLADHVASSRWWVRAGQAAADTVSVPLAGEHFGRRPRAHLGALGLEVLDSERTALGVIERVHARHPG